MSIQNKVKTQFFFIKLKLSFGGLWYSDRKMLQSKFSMSVC